MITIDAFRDVELRVAKIDEVANHPNADKLYVIKVNLGVESRQIVAGIKEFYPDPLALLGKNIVIVCNLEPRSIRGMESQGMMLAVRDDNGLAILTTDKDISPGSRVS